MKRTIEIDVPTGFKPVITELCGMEGVITFVKDDEFWKEVTNILTLHEYARRKPREYNRFMTEADLERRWGFVFKPAELVNK